MKNKIYTYIRIIPDLETINKIVQFSKNDKIACDDFIADPHCTILYSKDIVNIDSIKLPEIKFPIIGSSPRFEIFDARSYGPEYGFCLVMSFDCEVARSLFSKIKSEYKINSSPDDCNPHVTIKKNFELSLNHMPEIPFNLIFDKIKMDNGE